MVLIYENLSYPHTRMIRANLDKNWPVVLEKIILVHLSHISNLLFFVGWVPRREYRRLPLASYSQENSGGATVG